MLDRDEFLKKYRIDKEEFDTSGSSWEDLMRIYAHYANLQTNLEPTAQFFANVLSPFDAVHSIRWRVKDPEHLIEKIIRNRLKDISEENYKQKIKDLIGVRVLHLFKDDWDSIHDQISQRWDFHNGYPIAYVREGDSPEYIMHFKERGCEIRNHPVGYRSVHYVIEYTGEKEMLLVEIQVRTIFEEGWSEIDHKIRYPYETDNVVFTKYLKLFNRMAGAADEMGTYVKDLKREWTRISEIAAAGVKEKDLEKLEELLRNLGLLEEPLAPKLGDFTSRFASSTDDLEEILRIRRDFFGADIVSSDDSYRLCWGRNPDAFKIIYDEDKKSIGYWGLIPMAETDYREFLRGEISHEKMLAEKALNWSVVDPDRAFLYVIGVVVPVINKGGGKPSRIVAGRVLLDMIDFALRIRKYYQIVGATGYPSRDFGHSVLLKLGFVESGVLIEDDENQPVCFVAEEDMGVFFEKAAGYISGLEDRFLPIWEPDDKDRFVASLARRMD